MRPRETAYPKFKYNYMLQWLTKLFKTRETHLHISIHVNGTINLVEGKPRQDISPIKEHTKQSREPQEEPDLGVILDRVEEPVVSFGEERQ